MSNNEEEVSRWKKKWEASEENLQTLKKLAHVAIADYEDLQRKYDQNQKQYEELKKRLQEREEQIQNLQGYIEPAVDQYNELTVKYEIEKGCRSEAETYASKMVKQNNMLKRQSQMLLDKMTSVDTNINVQTMAEITEASENLKEDEDMDKRFEHLNGIIEKLQEQVSTLNSKLSRADADREDAIEKELIASQQYEQEREAHRRTQDSLTQHETSLRQFKRVSTRAFDEFQDLKGKYQKERVLKDVAENYAHKMLSEKNAIARESSVLLASAASNEQLHNALLEIETLTKSLEEERLQHKKQIEELEAELVVSKDLKQMSELETKVEELIEQVEQLQSQAQETEKWKDKLRKENEDLTNQLDVANQKLNPPPPPAPPLPPIGGIFKSLERFTKKRKPQPLALALQGNDSNRQVYGSAIDEMMQRIKQGQTLRPANKFRRPSLPDFPTSPTEVTSPPPQDKPQESAMKELHKMYTTMKRNPPAQPVLEPVREQPGSASDENELKRTIAKITQGARSSHHLSLIREEEERMSLSSNSSQNDSMHGKLELQESNNSTTL